MTYSSRDILFFGVPPYWFWAGVGFLVSVIFYMFQLYKNQKALEVHFPMLAFGGIGLIVGAKLFGCLTKLLTTIQTGDEITLLSLAQSGIVFYGGVLGFVSNMLLVYWLKFKSIPWDIFDLLALSIPLFHSFARIGCFCGGCCYGKETDSYFAILYETNHLEAASRIPVQLYEALALLVIFVVLLNFYKQRIYQSQLLKIYFLSYAIVRFFLEFLRGDLERGVFGFISFSQIISVVVLILIVFKSYIWRRKIHE